MTTINPLDYMNLGIIQKGSTPDSSLKVNYTPSTSGSVLGTSGTSSNNGGLTWNGSAPTQDISYGSTSSSSPSGYGTDPNFRYSGWGQDFGTGASGQAAYEAYRAQQDATRNAINSGYDQYFSSLDKQLGLLPEQQKNYEDQVGTQFNSQSGSLKTGQDNTLADLTNVENKTNANRVNSLRDLEDNIRNQIQAGNTYLGARGAGDSSASNMLSFAYTQLGNKQRSGIMRDANQSLADIGLRKNQVVNTYNDQMKQLNEWKSNQILSIAQQINQARQQIEQARASGYVEKGQALAGLNQQLMQNAFAKLQQIDAQAANFQSGLQNWANTHATNLNQYLSMLQGYGNASAPTLATTPLGGINYNSNNNSSDGLTNYSSGQGKRWDPVTQRYV